MRLSDTNIETIKRTATSVFGAGAEVYLFGSRTLDHKKGGDIDLLVRTEDSTNRLKKRLQFLAQVKLAIGDQKIDLLVRPKDQPALADLIYLEALKGVKL